MNLNKATIIGNLTRDPEQKGLPSGLKLTTFSVATNRLWTDSKTGQKKESVEFHDIVAWGRLADLCHKYLKKAKKVYVEGRLRTSRWEDDDKRKHSKTEIVAENVIFLTPTAKALKEAEELRPEEVTIEEAVSSVD